MPRYESAVTGAGVTSSMAAGTAAPPSSWRVLVVDDEPQVHAVTQMMLAHTEFRGMPVTLHSAYSAKEAMTFVSTHKELALILLDVVMETDDAGLRFCRYVREELRNDDVQIVLRTGQPGQAPERDVIVNHGINGYLLKTEVTSQKLHSILISSLRTYDYIRKLKQSQVALNPQEHELSTTERKASGEALSEAIAQGELELVARPQVELRTGAVVGVELRALWRTDEHGVLSQDEIASIVRTPELAALYSNWSIRRACEVAKSWQNEGLDGLRVAVGLSAKQLDLADIDDIVRRSLAVTGLAPEFLELEIAESTLTLNGTARCELLRKVRQLGVGIAVNRCGTGVASLARLRRLQPDRLKIDSSLIGAVDSDEDGAAITRAIIALAHTMHMSVVAEGVENEKQLEFLKWEECELAQGEYFSSPMAVEHVASLILGKAAGVQ